MLANFIMENLRLVWTRLTLSKITIAYVKFTILHCIVQVALQSDAYVQNSSADAFLKAIVRSAGIPTPPGINILVKDGPLYFCENLGKNWSGCEMVWAPKKAADSVNSTGTTTSAWDDGYYSSSYTASSTPSSSSSSSVVASSTATPTSSSVVKSTQAISATNTVSSSKPKPTAGPDVDEDDDEDKEHTHSTTVSSSSPAPTSTSAPVVDAIELDTNADGVIEEEIVPLPPSVVSAAADFINQGYRRSLWMHQKRSLRVGAASFDANGTLVSVPVFGLPAKAVANAVGAGAASSTASTISNGTGAVNLSATCVRVLEWPLQNLATSGREDIVFLVFNIWVLGMSFVAILNESMPHMIAALVTHLLMTAWTAFQIVATMRFRSEFLRITRDGACRGINLLPHYWQQRQNVELAELILNVLALLLSSWLSWRLVKQFGWQTFKRVGASLSVNHMYKLVLGLSVVLQLSMFFIVSSMAIWIEQICNGPARALTRHALVYEILYLIVIILLIPWAACGWFGVRRENKDITMIFLIGAVMVITSWGGMFFSHVFRLLFSTWGFFAMLTIIAMILSGITLVLGIACRLKFGKNSKVLASYLKPDEESLSEKHGFGDEDFKPEYGEKFDFPASDIPSYDAIMQRGGAPAPITIPLDAHTNPSTRTGSPFSSRSSSPTRGPGEGDAPAYDPSGRSSVYTTPSQAHGRSASNASSFRSFKSSSSHGRSGSAGSRTLNTSYGTSPTNSKPSRYDGIGGVSPKSEWVIE